MRAIFGRKPVGENRVASTGDRRDSITPGGGGLRGLEEGIDGLSIVSLKLIGALVFVSAHGSVKTCSTLPCQQIRSLGRPLFEQQLDVLFSPRETFHVIG